MKTLGTMPEMTIFKRAYKEDTSEQRKAMALYLDKLREYWFAKEGVRRNNPYSRKAVAEEITRRGVKTAVGTLDKAMRGMDTLYSVMFMWASVVRGSVDDLGQIAQERVNPKELAERLARRRWNELAASETKTVQLLDDIQADPMIVEEIIEVARVFRDNPRLRAQIRALINLESSSDNLV